MAHVDALSRAPVCLFIKTDDIIKAQMDTTNNIYTPVFNVVTNVIHSENLPEEPLVQTLPAGASQDIVNTIHNYGKDLVIIPASLIKQVLEAAHDNTGHPGIRTTEKHIKYKYFWPNMRNDIKAYVSSCHSCQVVKTSNHSPYGKLQPLPTPAHPMEQIAMDTIVMGSSAKTTKAKYIQVVIDHHTRYVWAKATATNTAEAALSLIQEIINTVGTPKRLLTDNYKNFRSKTFQRFMTANGVNRSFTTSYHPQCNGTNEKVNGTIVRRLRIECDTHPRHKWSTLLKSVVDSYNNTIHTVNGFSPTYLMFGSDKLQTSDIPLTEARKIAQRKSDEAKGKLKINFDKHHPSIEFKIGDLVKRRIASNRPDFKKLSPRYEAVFEVISVDSTVNATIKDYPNGQPADAQRVHISQLEPYFLRTESFAPGV